MKNFIKFLLITVMVIVAEGAYFEYCVSRELNEWLSYSATVIAVIIFAFYLKYVVKQTIKLLKLT